MPGRTHYKRTIWDSFKAFGNPGVADATAQRLYLVPLEIPVLMTVSHIGKINGDTPQGNGRHGIYADGAAGDTPAAGALVVGSASIAHAGATRKQEFVIADTLLQPGLYWMAFLSLAGALQTNFYTHWGQVVLAGTLQTYIANIAADTLPNPCPGVSFSNEPPQMYVLVDSVP